MVVFAGIKNLEKLNNGKKDLKKLLLSFYTKKLKLVLIGQRYKFNLKLQKEQRLSIQEQKEKVHFGLSRNGKLKWVKEFKPASEKCLS